MRCVGDARALAVAIVAAIAMLGSAREAAAQFSGSHSLGDFGVASATQPAPGLYVAAFYYRYDTDTVKDSTGRQITVAPGTPASVTVSAFAPVVWYVGKGTILGGAHYGVMAVIPVANSAIQVPIFGLDTTTSTKLADSYFRPLDLGWHKPRADVSAGFGLYTPTGTFVPKGSGNTGRGMWTSEPYVGTTVYFDEKRTFSAAALASYEIHSQKQDTAVTVGQILNLEGGVGKSFLGGGASVGAAYYAVWKVTADNLGLSLPPALVGIFDPTLNKDRRFAVGPDVTLPVASKSKLFALVNIRYLWEMGARVSTQGNTLVIMATFPVPSVKLK
jgi:hypothetical protein